MDIALALPTSGLCTSQEAALLPAYLPSLSVSNTAPFNLSSFALSLLLVGLSEHQSSTMSPRKQKFVNLSDLVMQSERIVGHHWQVFRTNSSYGRWDEARKLWGSVTNRSRDFARQVRVSYYGCLPAVQLVIDRPLDCGTVVRHRPRPLPTDCTTCLCRPSRGLIRRTTCWTW